ncbi:MAG: 7-carboxy-7-deazaguanine synthase QueE [Methanophagales archaeon]|nr:7-carboxy-7-deazaguanine synthase QueE [Methanophagales archaeon]
MKKGYVTEIFSSFQGEGPYAGRRQIFARFAGCPLSCFYCDTSYARDPRQKLCNVLFLDKKTRIKRNPISTNAVIDCIKELLTPDVHSICYTGGEPLSSAAFVKEIAAEAKSRHLKNFIETSGISARAFASLADYFDFASIDIKLRNHGAVEEKDYDRLYENELECIRSSIDRGIETIVKVVVVKNTPVEEIEGICEDLAGLDVKFVLQPVTAPSYLQSANVVPSIKELFELSETAGLYLHHIMVIPQVHKFMHIC